MVTHVGRLFALVAVALVAICGATGGGVGAWVIVVGLLLWRRNAAPK